MAKSSEEYWWERAEQREDEAAAEGAELSEQLYRQYQAAARRIRAQISDFYARYAGEQGLSYDEAVRELNRPEMQQWRGTLGEYLDAIKAAADENTRAKLQAELDAVAYNSRITRLQALEGQINGELNNLYARGVAEMREAYGAAFTEGYYKKVFDIQQRAGFMTEFAHVDTDMVEDIVSYPWSGAHFSDRLWRNKQALIFSTREILTRGAIEGTGIAPMSKQLADVMGQSYHNAQRLVMTEMAHFHEEATFKAYDAAHVEEYKYLARLSEKTCEVCGALDGKTFKVKDRQEGVNAPVMHPHCHCITVEHDPDEALDWAESGQEMPRSTSYAEWREAQGMKDDRKPKPGKPGRSSLIEPAVDKLYNGGVVVTPKQAGKKLGKHAKDFGMNAGSERDRQRMLEIIQDVATGYDEIRRGSYRGQGPKTASGKRLDGEVDFYIKGKNVVVAREGQFVTILKDGTKSKRVRDATTSYTKKMRLLEGGKEE